MDETVSMLALPLFQAVTTASLDKSLLVSHLGVKYWGRKGKAVGENLALLAWGNWNGVWKP